MTAFDWDAYDRLCDELHGAYLAYDSWHRSMVNLEYQGWDEHGVYPGEEGILNRAIAEIRQKIAALGTPPACTTCRGAGEYHAFYEVPTTGERFYDEWPSRCPACGGSGKYQGEG